MCIRDSDKNIHEQITRVPGSFEKSLNGIYATKQAGMALQINTTVMKENLEAIPGLLDFASEVDAEIVLLYQLVPEGRGSKEMELSTRQYLSLLEMVKEKQIQCRAVIEPTCSPQYWAFLMEQKWSDGKGKIPAPAVRLARALFKGCVAGSGLCYIKPDGDVWPCPFVPVSGGNVREKPLDEIWYHAPVFQNLRERERLTGVKCRICRHRDICGGCRGRAYA
ncbi:MAG: SPASM domain-containing protein, partial [Dehalococcoidales bacterium]|nr:SPASM domain-containing protein [Dehalococcoidales bacterium]